jgi:2-polyprenyl-3-methyl-5-hydroxy-6-metoxy-1,4-benzoquinol methylase
MRKAAVERPIERYASDHPQLAQESSLPAALVRAVEDLTAGATVLDVGCGEGGTMRALCSRRLPATVIGCDLSLHRARLANEGRPTAIVGNGEHLPVAPESCDVAVCRHVIEHVDDQLLLTELVRVLKPEGLLYLETPLRLSFAWYPYRNAEGRWVLDPTHVREYASVEEIARSCRASGLQVLEHDTHPIRYSISHLWQRVARRLGGPSGRLAARVPTSRRTIAVPRYREVRMLARRFG